jgi:hypothetical protein
LRDNSNNPHHYEILLKWKLLIILKIHLIGLITQ